MPEADASRRYAPLKRTLDVVGAAVGLLFFAPAFALFAIAIKLTSRGRAVFVQPRIGRDGETFRLYKFRTMVDGAEERLTEVMHLDLHGGPGRNGGMYKIAGDPRVTMVGRFLRRYSLDELPQLVNVLKGEMSLVGPRPLTADEDKHVRGAARIRNSVRPGITGPWQVSGRNDLSFEDMMRLDVEYVLTHSLRSDLVLLANTAPVALRGQPPC